MGTDWDCECSEDYGACEDHRDVLAQREGASSRTADDLMYVFLTDVLTCAEGSDIRQGAETNLIPLRRALYYWGSEKRWNDNHGCRWVKETEPNNIHDEMSVGESVLADLGLSVDWDDGYVISRTHPDCPLLNL
jgi:hypothetical protein